nr:helix-turn-helix domain-containing protein [Adlercreutzia sp. DFI.6.23]
MNQATCAHGQKLTLAHQRARDKVASVLLRLEAALLRDPAFGGTVPLSYDDIAFLACTERATTSRELKAFAHDGLIDLSYRRIGIKQGLHEHYGHFIEAHLPFYDEAG